MCKKMVMSDLAKTWIFDLDGTLVKHNGYKIDGKDTLLNGVKEFLADLPQKDKIIILTARTSEYKEMTLKFLNENQIRFDNILFDMSHGERILINDMKPSGLKTAVAINLQRNDFNCSNILEIDKNL